jgi:hypothetical protein
VEGVARKIRGDSSIQEKFCDARLYSTILPIGDGVALSLKLRD